MEGLLRAQLSWHGLLTRKSITFSPDFSGRRWGWPAFPLFFQQHIALLHYQLALPNQSIHIVALLKVSHLDFVFLVVKDAKPIFLPDFIRTSRKGPCLQLGSNLVTFCLAMQCFVELDIRGGRGKPAPTQIMICHAAAPCSRRLEVVALNALQKP